MLMLFQLNRAKIGLGLHVVDYGGVFTLAIGADPGRFAAYALRPVDMCDEN